MLIESGNPDPFLPIGLRIAPTQEDIQAAERVADVLQQCLDYADGDNALFTAEFQRRTMNVPMPSRKRNQNKFLEIILWQTLQDN